MGNIALAFLFLYPIITIKYFSDSLIVYVHDVTALKTAQRDDIKCFNMHLQTPDKTYWIVSYHHELHYVFSKAQESTSPKSSPLSKGIQINLTTKKKTYRSIM